MSNRRVAGAAIALVAVVFLVFSPTLRPEFLRYDDEIYIFYNPHLQPLNAENIGWVLTHGYYRSYIPLTMLSHSIDAAIWGLDARGHHLTNILLHAFTAGWVFLIAMRLFRRMELGGGDAAAQFGAALGAALLFALHPLRVESVAWISDRKDLLLGFFLCASLYLYIGESEDKGLSRSRWIRRLSLFLFLCAALSKSTAVVAPLVFVLLEVFLLKPPASRDSLVKSIRGSIPFLVVSGIAGVAAVSSTEGSQLHYVLRESGPVTLGLLPLYSAGFYLIRFVLPFGLTPVYLPPDGVLMTLGVAIAVVLSAAAVILLMRGRPAAFVAWCAYLLLLLPTLAGLPAGIQPWADRYTYVTLISLALFIGGGAVPPLVAWWKRGQHLALPATGIVVVGGLTALTLIQTGYWRDSVTLWRHAVQTTPQAGALTLVPLGVAYFHAGNIDSALVMYQHAVSEEPEYVEGYFSMGEAYAARGELASAAQAYQEALDRDSLHFGSRNNLADIYLKSGRVDDALAMYERLVRRHPGNARVRNNFGFALERKGDLAGAIEQYRKAIDLEPGFLHPYVNIGSLYCNAGQAMDAVAFLERARALDGDDSRVHYNLGRAYEALNRSDEAERAYRSALVAEPKFVDGWVSLIGLIARNGRVGEARELARRVVASLPDVPDLRVSLGGMYLAGRDFEKAAREFQEAIRLEPDFAPAYYSLGLLYREQSDTAAARQAFQTAARFGSEPARKELGIVPGTP